MKKLLVLGSLIFLLAGCGDMGNTPTKKVEDFLGKYQSMDSEVLAQLDTIIDEENDFTDDQKTDYKSLMEKQYQNLSYKIQSENINDDEATVETEIEVYDYRNALDKAEDYRSEHQDEFMDEDGKEDYEKFMSYRIEELKKVSDKKKYNITFHLQKEDGDWVLEDISDSDREKIHGLYQEVE